MMPKMDGIETTKKIRDFGYKGFIVALTANALVGNEEMFKRNGFDGFIPKPIDIRQLNSALNKLVRDRYPEEAIKYKPRETAQKTVNSKVMQVFKRDAEKAVMTLRKTLEEKDMKLYVTTVHAMKSAAANIGEKEVSELAKNLETAGLKNDMKFVKKHTEELIEKLGELIAKINSADETDIDDGLEEDYVFLRTELQNIKTAAEEYSTEAIYAAVNRLKEKQWKAETLSSIEEIYDKIFLESDFDDAAELTSEFLARL
jgi:CheY-like chemotaxis protein